MPLLLCPNDNDSMRTVQRSGVEFDICPTCRGVWLDRGELEKLMAASDDGDSGDRDRAPPRPPQRGYEPPPESYPRARREWRDDDDDNYRKKRRPSLFDLFD